MQITFLQFPNHLSLHPWQHARRAGWLRWTFPEGSTQHCDWHTKQWPGGSVGGKDRERFLQSPDSAIKSQQGPSQHPVSSLARGVGTGVPLPAPCHHWLPPAWTTETPINARICTSASPHPLVLWTSGWPFLQACRYFRARSKAPHCHSANPCWFQAGLGQALRKGVTPEKHCSATQMLSALPFCNIRSHFTQQPDLLVSDFHIGYGIPGAHPVPALMVPRCCTGSRGGHMATDVWPCSHSHFSHFQFLLLAAENTFII